MDAHHGRQYKSEPIQKVGKKKTQELRTWRNTLISKWVMKQKPLYLVCFVAGIMWLVVVVVAVR